MTRTRLNGRATLTLAALLGLVALGGACSRKASMAGYAPPMSVAAPMTAVGGGGGSAAATPSADRAMRITIETTLVVAHRDAAVSALRATVSGFGGYVSEGTVTGPDVGGSALFTVKVPAPSIADFRGKLAGLGEVKSDSEKAEDVTEARADMKARLRNARAEDQRLLDLLANHTGTLADVVLVEKELAQVRETIERFEAEERTLEGQISFATVKVSLETVYVPPSEGPMHELAAAKDGVVSAKGFVFGLLTVTLSAGPTLLIMAAMAYVAIRLVRAWLRRRRQARA